MKFVAVKAFDSYVTANIWLGRLEEENIVCFLQDEHSVTINPALSNAIGGIKLCVTQAQLQRCQELIMQYESENASRCPACCSTDIQLEEKETSTTGFLKRLLAEMFSFRSMTGQYSFHCNNCDSWFEELPAPLSLQQDICSEVS